MLIKWKIDPESVPGIGASPKVNQFFRLVGPITTQSFHEIDSLQAPHSTLVKEALIEIGCIVTSLVGCHARALWPNGAS